MKKDKWYYSINGVAFVGFSKVSGDHGPFDTFTEAKNHAIGFFMGDRNDALTALYEIRDTKKADVDD